MRERESARLLVIDSEQRLLLFHVNERGSDDPARDVGSPARDRTFWITPGGGVEPGESVEDAARRELLEETGLRAGELGNSIYYREKLLENSSGRVLSKEHYFLVRLNAPAMISTDGFLEPERSVIDGYRWWPVAELNGADDVIYPEGLADLACSILTTSET